MFFTRLVITTHGIDLNFEVSASLGRRSASFQLPAFGFGHGSGCWFILCCQVVPLVKNLMEPVVEHFTGILIIGARTGNFIGTL